MPNEAEELPMGEIPLDYLLLTSDDARIERVLQHIDAHLDRPVSLKELAREAAVERRYLSLLFQRKTGWRCFDYVRHRRLARAQELLQHASVEQVAAAVGCHVRTLERTFSRQTGVTPGEYRLRQTKGLPCPYRK